MPKIESPGELEHLSSPQGGPLQPGASEFPFYISFFIHQTDIYWDLICSKYIVRLGIQKWLSHCLFPGKTHSVFWRSAWEQLILVRRGKCCGCYECTGKCATPSAWEIFAPVFIWWTRAGQAFHAAFQAAGTACAKARKHARGMFVGLGLSSSLAIQSVSHKSRDSLEDERADIRSHNEFHKSHVYMVKTLALCCAHPCSAFHHHQPMRTEDSNSQPWSDYEMGDVWFVSLFCLFCSFPQPPGVLKPPFLSYGERSPSSDVCRWQFNLIWALVFPHLGLWKEFLPSTGMNVCISFYKSFKTKFHHRN